MSQYEDQIARLGDTALPYLLTYRLEELPKLSAAARMD